MADKFVFRLPDWPPRRLVKEAVMSYNLRHLGEPLLDRDASPWPLVRGAVLAFLRHQQSNYHDRLRGEYDQELRDSLATELTQAAYRRYPWIGKDDPRPFTGQPEDGPPAQLFTEIARDLAHYHGVRDHLSSAIRDLKREGNKQAQIKTLQDTLAEVEKRIARSYELLTGPKYLHDEHGSQSRGFGFPHLPEEMGHYYFFEDRAVTPNRYHYQGFAVLNVMLRSSASNNRSTSGKASECSSTLASVTPGPSPARQPAAS